VAPGVSSVGANLDLLLLAGLIDEFFVFEVEHEDLDLLHGKRLRDHVDGELLIRPVLT
jgi:hypothetical protein